ncbi:Gfo/Idh/MocA family oxidoreductase [Phycicoccus sp. MAQZ13P-2]|uniref:Gfo/Idh/MocA family protein n=1 Tax=Phycicoccus mangrovi TaxID=2840470 RepID=UPI001BFFF5E8|nr:Gfo/Idh/MocA family oxidoreductase [Phycicoccus mangrovi]MBT9255915.1 Gfo/Idh/MocA family oxidoreductase [Phycicoccus mangrovi]MBT9274509.1 Gfo/Idh/MocA family oxidoreductase [Phycicoccus mangrovi]
MTATLRAGLVGLGMMGRHHARVLDALPGVELVALADPGGDPHGVAGGRPVGRDVQHVLDIGVDCCVVSVPTAHHEPVAVALAEAGVATLVEKPLALDVAAAERVVEAFRSRGVLGAVGHVERYNPALQQARRRLEHGQLGELYQVATRRQGPFPRRIGDVGVVMDLGTHDIDITEWVTQQPLVSVSARTTHRSGRAHEDLVAVVGQLADGGITNHLVNWLSPFKERLVVLTGTEGSFVVDTLAADLTFHANGPGELPWDAIAQFRGVSEGDVVRYSFAKPEPLRTELEAFRDAVLGVGSDVVTLESALRTIRVAAACLDSARTGTTVGV